MYIFTEMFVKITKELGFSIDEKQKFWYSRTRCCNSDSKKKE